MAANVSETDLGGGCMQRWRVHAARPGWQMCGNAADSSACRTVGRGKEASLPPVGPEARRTANETVGHSTLEPEWHAATLQHGHGIVCSWRARDTERFLHGAMHQSQIYAPLWRNEPRIAAWPSAFGKLQCSGRCIHARREDAHPLNMRMASEHFFLGTLTAERCLVTSKLLRSKSLATAGDVAMLPTTARLVMA